MIRSFFEFLSVEFGLLRIDTFCCRRRRGSYFLRRATSAPGIRDDATIESNPEASLQADRPMEKKRRHHRLSSEAIIIIVTNFSRSRRPLAFRRPWQGYD